MSETKKDDLLVCEKLGRCPTPLACSNPYECRDAKRSATPPVAPLPPVVTDNVVAAIQDLPTLEITGAPGFGVYVKRTDVVLAVRAALAERPRG